MENRPERPSFQEGVGVVGFFAVLGAFMGAESATSPIAGGVVSGIAGLGAVLLKRIFGQQ